MTKWKWSSSFLCKKISSFKSQKSYSFYFGFFQVSPVQPLPPTTLPLLSRLTQKSGNLQSEDVHLFASSGGAGRVTLGWMGTKENPELWQWGTNWQRPKLLQKDIFYTVCSVNLNWHPSVVCLSLSFDLHHRWYTPPKHVLMISTRCSKENLIGLTLFFETIWYSWIRAS
jgi:hypothetical protein